MDLFLAGAESAHHLICAYVGSRYANHKPSVTVLASYYKFRTSAAKKNGATIKSAEKFWLLHEREEIRTIMDSGLFTMMFGVGKGNTYTTDDLREYTKAYLGYLLQRKFRGVAVEMDVHKVLGLEALAEFRAICADLWPAERMIYVWHVEEKLDGLRALVDKYPYIALSVPELRIIAATQKLDLKAMTLNLLRVIRGEPKGKDVRVHLLGCTQTELMLNDMYDTVDSTSWEYPFTFGRVKVFKPASIDKYELRQRHEAYQADPAIAEIKRKLNQQEAQWSEVYGMRLNPYKGEGAFGAYAFANLEAEINKRYFAASTRKPYDPWAGL
jgi:hypothetical protein